MAELMQEKRQSQWGSVDQLLGKLAEVSFSVLEASVSVQKRLYGETSKVEGASPSKGVSERAPLLQDVEQRVKESLERIIEAIQILQSIKKEID